MFLYRIRFRFVLKTAQTCKSTCEFDSFQNKNGTLFGTITKPRFFSGTFLCTLVISPISSKFYSILRKEIVFKDFFSLFNQSSFFTKCDKYFVPFARWNRFCLIHFHYIIMSDQTQFRFNLLRVRHYVEEIRFFVFEFVKKYNEVKPTEQLFLTLSIQSNICKIWKSTHQVFFNIGR